MSKWPDRLDREWPKDLPPDYFYGRATEAGISWSGCVAVIIGLCRRVDELESKMAHLLPDKSDDI